jgi:hypothetical protein
MRRMVVIVAAAVAGGVMPGVSHGQAIGISRPATIPDNTFLQRQCAQIMTSKAGVETERPALESARDACKTYLSSPRDQSSRETFLLRMLALQNNLGEKLMRDLLVPQFGGALPANLASYSLFLVPDARWRSADFAKQRQALWEAAFAFGRAIGDTHAAIWFLDHDDNVDVLRSQEYCRRFGLSYNDGPYVVTIRKRPDLLTADDEIVVIRMGGIAPENIPPILNRLTQDLTTSGRPGTGGLVYEEIKQRIVTLVAKYPGGARAFISAVLGL